MPTNFGSALGFVAGMIGLAACGGGSLDPGAGDDPGGGTATLAIEGSVHASPRLANARLRTDFDADFTVRVSLGNQAVTTGTVTVTSGSGKISLTYRNDSSWSASAPSYDEVYVLDVVSGSDEVEGVRVDGPDIHVFSAPTEDASIDTTMPLAIKWERGDRAEITELRTDNRGAIEMPDTGSYSLAGGSLKADKSQPRQRTLRLLRTNRVAPAGGAAGSTWGVTIENQLDVVAEAQPPAARHGR
jgi:hypothetical protein